MILANTRARLGRDDAQLVVRLIAHGSGRSQDSAEAKLADEGLDPLLDDPRLLEGLLSARQGAHASWPLFAYVLVRHALRTAGEEDRPLADYVASILLHFGLRQRATRIAQHDDATYDTLASLAADVEGRDASRSFLARAHLGNYALWLSGLFPDHIEQRRWRRGGPDLGYFETMGQRGFQLAADHRLAGAYGLAPVFAAAAAHFPRLRVALNRVSDRLLFPLVHTPERLMRQVRDDVRWRAS
ncbi:hypothetical protein [Gemmatimonas sp.]|jgi:hypothetical protein|uniref:hypothetical protein n=1 Tax=Gemmatimonas sp. TaxID=1962908 RepID=UPI0037C0DE09